MKKVLIGLSTLGIGYQTYGIYSLFNPPSYFKGGWERLNEARSQPKSNEKKLFTNISSENMSPAGFPKPSGLFLIRRNFPEAELSSYLSSSKGDFFYLNFRDFPLDSGNLYNYILSKLTFNVEKAEIIDEEGEENLMALLKELSFRMMEKMSMHLYSNMRASLSSQAWIDYFYRRFLSNEKLKAFRAIRYPVILIEGCEEWQKVLDEDTGNDESKIAKKNEKAREILNFILWLYYMKSDAHIVMLTNRPIDQVLAIFDGWQKTEFTNFMNEENAPPPAKS